MDPGRIRSQRLAKPQIWYAAEWIRDNYIRNTDIPVDIEIVSERIGISIIHLINLRFFSFSIVPALLVN